MIAASSLLDTAPTPAATARWTSWRLLPPAPAGAKRWPSSRIEQGRQRFPHMITQRRLRPRHRVQVVVLEVAAIGGDRFKQERQQCDVEGRGEVAVALFEAVGVVGAVVGRDTPADQQHLRAPVLREPGRGSGREKVCKYVEDSV